MLVKESSQDSTEQITADLYPKKFGKLGRIWTLGLLLVCLVGVYAYYRQIKYGLVVTEMRDYVSWGIYISNFVFFVAISLVGSLITACLLYTGVHWSTPLTLSLIHISEPTRLLSISYAVFCLKKKKK